MKHAATMDHKTFIDKVSQNSHLSKTECGEFLNAFIDLMETSLAEGDTISIPSFGNFEPRKRNERIMSHPSNPGTRLLIPPKVVVSFKPSTILKNKINNIQGDE